MGKSPWAALPFLFGFPLAPIVMVSVTEGGWWTYVPIFVVFVAVPILDALGGVIDEDRVSPDFDRNLWFKLVTWAWVPVQLGLLAWVLATAANGHLTTLELVGMAVSMGVTAGA